MFRHVFMVLITLDWGKGKQACNYNKTVQVDEGSRWEIVLTGQVSRTFLDPLKAGRSNKIPESGCWWFGTPNVLDWVNVDQGLNICFSNWLGPEHLKNILLLWYILKYHISGSQRGLNTGRDDMAPVSKHRGNVRSRILSQAYRSVVVHILMSRINIYLKERV